MRQVVFVLFSPNEQRGAGGGGRRQTFSFCSLFPVQQTTGGIGPRAVLSTYPLHTICGCGKERRTLIGPW